MILYHLGVGAGVPPTDRGELEYTYEKNLKVLPSFAVVPAFGSMGGIGSMPGLSFNFAMLLHGEQDVRCTSRFRRRRRVTRLGPHRRRSTTRARRRWWCSR